LDGTQEQPEMATVENNIVIALWCGKQRIPIMIIGI
jgi:hypothetical protein